MSKFALEKIEAINGKQVFEKIFIDGGCQFDEYEKEINEGKKYKKDLGKIYFYFQEIADLRVLPKEKFRDITPNKETVKEYEFKSGDLRVYAFKKDNGKIIVWGGYKNSQERDLIKFRSIKKMYLIDQKLKKDAKR